MDIKKMLRKHEVEALIWESWSPSPQQIRLNTLEAAGYVLAEDQFSRHSQPVVRAAGMDGVAINFDAYKEAGHDTSAWTLGVEYARADTGDDFDDRYDTVIPVERVEFLENGGIRILEKMPGGPGGPKGPGGPGRPGGPKGPGGPRGMSGPIERGMNIRPAGSNVSLGEALVKAGTLLKGRHLSALIMGGVNEIPVIKKPRVGFIPTGSELIAPGQELKRGNNMDSNSIMASCMIGEMHGEAVSYPIVKDKVNDLEAALDKALAECDIVLINGGSSKGSEDYNTRLLREKGKFLFHQVAAAPGRPMSAAIVSEKLVLNIAGPSAAALHGLDWIVRKAICRYLGMEEPLLPTVQAVLEEDLFTPPPMSLLTFVMLTKTEEGYRARPLMRGEKDPSCHSLAADGIYYTEYDCKGHKKGETITVEVI